MKIGTFNIRGLGSSAKKEELWSFFLKNDLDLCCVQETMIINFSKKDGAGIWKNRGIKWCAEGSIGRSGGVLTFWDEERVCCSSGWGIGGAAVVNGRCKRTGEEFCLINVYAPCNRKEKILLWDRLAIVVEQRVETKVCIIGDFNSILFEGERVGESDEDSDRERLDFVEFIERSRLVDIELQGRRFTWYRCGGGCKSRLDRALVNDRWVERWPDTELRGLPRSISDHCALVLSTKCIDWGPKPFRFINAWIHSPGFKEKVADSWSQEGIQGWGGYVLKEKLKRLKDALKAWNRDQFGPLDKKVEELRKEVNDLDTRDDSRGLSEEEAARRNEATAQLLLQLKNKSSLLAQKAKMKWIKE